MRITHIVISGLLSMTLLLHNFCLAQENNVQPGVIVNIKDTTTTLKQIQEAMGISSHYPDSAINLLLTCREDSRITGFHYGALLSAFNLAKVYVHYDCGKIEDAMATLAPLPAQCRTEREMKLLPYIFNLMGNAENLVGKEDKALQYYMQAEKVDARYRTDSLNCMLYNNIGTCLMNNQRPSQSLYYFSKAEAIAEKGKYYSLYIYSLINKGEIYAAMKDYTTSEAVILKAIQIATAYKKGSDGHALALASLGMLYHRRDSSFQKAFTYLEQAVSPGMDVMTRSKLAILGNIALLKRRQGKTRESIRYYEEVLKLAQASGYRDIIQISRKNLARAYYSIGLYRNAFDYADLFMTLRDSIEAEKTIDNLNKLELQFRTALKDKELAENRLQLSLQERRIEKKNFWIIATISGALLLCVLLLLLYRNALHKRRLVSDRIQLLQHQQQIGRLKAMMEGEEKERKRLGRELHDGIGGMIAALKMGFSTLQEQYGMQRNKGYNDMMLLLDETGKEVRKTAHNLMPEMLSRLGLKDALEQYLTGNKSAWHPLHVELQAHGHMNDLPDPVQLAIYRTVQELVKNVVQHAKASQVLIQLNRDEDNVLSLMAEDDGIGFDQTETSQGIGLQNIKDRVNNLQGTLSIHSEKGGGTIIQIEYDLNKINTFDT